MFLCDFIIIVKICEGDVYHMYCDNEFFSKVICSLFFVTQMTIGKTINIYSRIKNTSYVG
jgi:hypothetical protein